MSKTELYDTLGVEPDASIDTINAAYRRRARETHPDKGGDETEFRAVTRAIAILRDPVKRAEYDQTGRADDEPDNDDAQLLKYLSHAFMECVDSMRNVSTTNLITAMYAWINQRKAMGMGSNNDARDELGKLRKVHGRLKFRGQGTDRLGRMLEDRIEGIEAQIASMDKQLDQLERSRELVKDYVYEVDAPPAAPYSAYPPDSHPLRDRYAGTVGGRRSGSPASKTRESFPPMDLKFLYDDEGK